jgi:hypothetical protein
VVQQVCGEVCRCSIGALTWTATPPPAALSVYAPVITVAGPLWRCLIGDDLSFELDSNIPSNRPGKFKYQKKEKKKKKEKLNHSPEYNLT